VVALFVGDTRKGFAVALEAVRRTPAVHLAVVSRSPAPEALQGARAGGLDGRLHWIGPLADPAPAYAAADLLLHPTIYDSFGLVVAEAMAWGLPVIVTAAAGISELLEHERSGWIVRGDPVSGTSEALAALAENADRRRSLADAGRARAVARSWDAVARETLQVYERVGARSHRR
jgi:UDP-glucose:(heptosyl)LPS alpha-1,3-glucosyltransferase